MSDIRSELAGTSGSLRRALTTLAYRLPDKARLQRQAIALLKGKLTAVREDIRHRFELGDLDGLAAAHLLSDLQDEIVQVLYDFTRKHFYYAQNPTEGKCLAILATGGYGRRELAPHSDIDLLFLRRYKRTAWSESVIELIVQMLWDLGLKVGHATRSIDECLRLARQDITVRTAILDAREICGDAELYGELRNRFRTEIAADSLHFVTAKLRERDERHLRQGLSRYLVEPNVKEGKGGLRDLQTLYWIGKYLYGTDDPADLIQHGVFTRDELLAFQRAEAFFWQVRFHLHYVTGRPDERLSFDLQPEIACRFGASGETPRRAVEVFMRRYFLIAKQVGDLTRIFCAALEEQNKKPKLTLLRLIPRVLRRRGNPLFVDNGRLNARGDAFKRDPANLLRIFEIAVARGLDVHPSALRIITRSLDLIDDRLRADSEANRLFLSMLTSRRDPERALRRLNESGVFGCFVPEFGRVVGLSQFNRYHHYTVDEHLIRAVGNVAAVEQGELAAEHPLSSDIVHRISSRNALYAAVLLHDIAKGTPGDHSEEGAAIADRLCGSWGLPAEDIATVSWLVRNHLVMSDTAQRRDISDAKTVRDFVDVVRTPERLKLLLILTVADIRAVGPGVWNGWKGQLLRDLYFAAEAAMAGHPDAQDKADRIAESKAALARRLPDFSAEARSAALARHSDSYWLAFETESQERHVRLIERLLRSGGELALEGESDAFRSVTEIVVATRDRPGLFSLLAGAITRSHGSIVDAKIFTTADGLALDTFSLQDDEGSPFGDAARIGRMQRNVLAALRGEMQLEPTRVRAPRNSSIFQLRPRIRFDNTASGTATVIEVQAADRPGLLHDVTGSLSDSSLSISSAIVATYGERAIDVFYVQDSSGKKITDTERQKKIENHLLERLSFERLEAAPA